MSLISAGSLGETVDAANEVLFFGRRISAGEREATARWIAGRHGQPHAYANTFALVPQELGQGIRLFTGERVRSAAARHIIGEEACRVLRQLRAADGAAKAALQAAASELHRRVGPAAPTGPKPDDGQVHWLWPYRGGTYCCGACSVALWRHILAGGFDRQEERLATGLRCLRDCRKGDNQWRIFPFWYTVLALSEMDSKLAQEELRYAAPRLEKTARRPMGTAPWAERRREVARRALALAS